MKKLTFLTDSKSDFEEHYLQVRDKEDRVYSDLIVANLPVFPIDHPQYKEWQLRKLSLDRFLDYLRKKRIDNILDLGCGNGWFTNHLSHTANGSVLGLDINENELLQGCRVHQGDNLQFAYGDIFEAEFSTSFDLVTLNACVQYFPDFSILIKRLKSLLSESGEIHILDSPFYRTQADANAAKLRSEKYFIEQNNSEMINHYHHHLISDLDEFEILYKPSSNIFRKLTGKLESPFVWCKFTMD